MTAAGAPYFGAGGWSIWRACPLTHTAYPKGCRNCLLRIHRPTRVCGSLPTFFWRGDATPIFRKFPTPRWLQPQGHAGCRVPPQLESRTRPVVTGRSLPKDSRWRWELHSAGGLRGVQDQGRPWPWDHHGFVLSGDEVGFVGGVIGGQSRASGARVCSPRVDERSADETGLSEAPVR
jgi:hypothetical protein